jgi:hypothetical protein
MRLSKGCLLAWLMIGLCPLSAPSAVINWTAAGNGNWGVGGNWAGGVVPGSADDANIPNTGVATVITFAADPSPIRNLIVNRVTTMQGTNRRLDVSGNLSVQTLGTVGSLTLQDVFGSPGPFTLAVAGNIDLGYASTAAITVGGASDLFCNALTGRPFGGLITVNGNGALLSVQSATELNYDLTVSQGIANFGGTLDVGAQGSAIVTISPGVTNGTVNLDGELVVSPFGEVIVSSSFSTLNANAPITVRGGKLTRHNGAFNLAVGGSVTVSGAGQFVYNNNLYTTVAGGIYTVSGGNSLMQFEEGLSVNAGASAVVGSGGTLEVTGSDDQLNVGTTASGGGDGFLSVDGVGALANVASTTAVSSFGLNSNSATVSFGNYAKGSFPGGINLAHDADANTNAVLNVGGNADLAVGHLNIAAAGGTSTFAALNIAGDGSTVTLGASKNLVIGHATEGIAVVNVSADIIGPGKLTVGTGGTTTINSTGTLNIINGNVDLKTLTVNSGKINFLKGSLSFGTSGGFTVGASGFLGANLVLGADRKLTVTAGGMTIDQGSVVLVDTIDGFTAQALTNNGELLLGGLAAAARGTTLSNGSTGLIRGEGRVVANVTNAGGEIRGEAGKRLKLEGTAGTNTGRINLQGGTVEFSSSLTNGTNGRIMGRGTLVTGGLTNSSGGHISFSSGITDVFGDVQNATGNSAVGITVSGNSDVTFWDDVTQTSGLFKVSAGSSVTFFNAYNGTGMTGTGTKYFEYDISPGFSPASVTMEGDVHLSSTATLKIELGGTTPGSGYDQFLVTGQLNLGGTLEISFINGFSPDSTDVFNILDWGSLVGTFDNAPETLDPISGSFYWDATQLYVDGTLRARIQGDFDGDGDVDGADFVAWQNNFPTTSGATLAMGDGDWDGDVDGADFVLWQNNFPYAPGSPGVVPVPEPQALVLLAAALPAWGAFRRRRRN